MVKEIGEKNYINIYEENEKLQIKVEGFTQLETLMILNDYTAKVYSTWKASSEVVKPTIKDMEILKEKN